MSETIADLTVRFPSDDEAAASQDTEWCEVVYDGETHTIRFHDYHEIYDIPGLYECIFSEHLKCRSPEVVIGLLQEQLEQALRGPRRARPRSTRVPGMASSARSSSASAWQSIVGVDIIPEAARAAERDRPEVYEETTPTTAGPHPARRRGERARRRRPLTRRPSLRASASTTFPRARSPSPTTSPRRVPGSRSTSRPTSSSTSMSPASAG